MSPVRTPFRYISSTSELRTVFSSSCSRVLFGFFDDIALNELYADMCLVRRLQRAALGIASIRLLPLDRLPAANLTVDARLPSRKHMEDSPA